jgi:ribokinase
MDDFGTGLTRNLTSRGVRADRVTRHEKLETGMAVIYVEKSGNNSIVVAPGANQACDEAYLRANDEAFQRCDYILLQIEIPQEAVHYAIARGKELGKTVILNPAPAPASIPEDVLKDLDYIIPNETELAKLSRRDSTREIDEIEAGALSLTALGVRTVIVTLGHNGCMLVQGCNVERFPSIQVKAVDTTAAGDCFCAAFAVALSDGKSAPEAIAFANVAAGLSVTKPGAQDSIPAREEVLRRLRL